MGSCPWLVSPSWHNNPNPFVVFFYLNSDLRLHACTVQVYIVILCLHDNYHVDPFELYCSIFHQLSSYRSACIGSHDRLKAICTLFILCQLFPFHYLSLVQMQAVVQKMLHSETGVPIRSHKRRLISAIPSAFTGIYREQLIIKLVYRVRVCL